MRKGNPYALIIWILISAAPAGTAQGGTMASPPAPSPAPRPAVVPSPPAPSTATPSSDVLRIGAVVSLSGSQAGLAQHLLRGYELAVRRINQAGGVVLGNRRYSLALSVQDDQSNPAQAAAAAEKLISDGNRLMVGPFSSDLVGAVAEVTERSQVPLVQSGGSSLALYREKPRRYFFGIPTTTDRYLTGAIEMAAEAAARRGAAPGDLRLALALQNNQAGAEMHEAVLAAAQQRGMRIVLDTTLPEPLESMVPVLRQVRELRPDLLLVFGYAQGALLTVRQMAELRVSVPMVVVTHCEGAQIERLGPISDYVICSSQWDPYTSYKDRWLGSAVDFLVEFELVYGYTPPYQAAQGAAAVAVLANAVERAGNAGSEAVREALARTDITTFFGPVQFDATGRNVAKPMLFTQLQGGRYKVVWPRNLAWAQLATPTPRWEDR